MTAFGIERNQADDVQRMADRVMAATEAASRRLTTQAARTVARIVDDTRGSYDRGVVGGAVASILQERVGLAWDGGWQPADLDRYVARYLKEPERQLLGDAMAHQLAQFVAATVDPSWWAQLDELDARTWWPADRSYLEARARTQEWHALVTSSVALIARIWFIPRIEKLGPAPGEATASTRRRDQPAVEQRILERVRALLAKAESTTLAAEAETFTAGAQALMARHSIDAALLAAARPHDAANGPSARRIGVGNPYESQKVTLLGVVADANRARTVWSRNLGYVTLIGHREDLDAAETLFTSLLVQATHAMAQQGKRTDAYGRSRTASFRRSFLTAFAVRIGERLREVTDAETQAVAAELAGEGQRASRRSGQELVPLLAERAAAVDQAVDAMFPSLVTRRAAPARDLEGWDSGTAAADLASLREAKEVDGRAG